MEQFTPDKICFGLSPELDTDSLTCFLQLMGAPEFSRELAGRMSSEEIDTFVSQVTHLLRKHFSEHEYHTMFLQQTRGK
jgi:hypothetical protein